MSDMAENLEKKLLRLQRRADFILMSYDADWALYVPGQGVSFYDCTLSSVIDQALDGTSPAVAEQRHDVVRPDPVSDIVLGERTRGDDD